MSDIANDPDYSQESREFANHIIIEETRASQPKTQSNLMSDLSEDFFHLTKGSGMMCLLMVSSKDFLWKPEARNVS